MHAVASRLTQTLVARLPTPLGRHPWVDASAFVAPNATVVGRVNLHQYSSVWYGAVVRGDLNDVYVGEYSVIQDRAVVHTTKSVEGHVAAATTIGNYVTVGPGAVLHSCIVEVRRRRRGARMARGAGALVGGV